MRTVGARNLAQTKNPLSSLRSLATTLTWRRPVVTAGPTSAPRTCSSGTTTLSLGRSMNGKLSPPVTSTSRPDPVTLASIIDSSQPGQHLTGVLGEAFRLMTEPPAGLTGRMGDVAAVAAPYV